MEEGRKAVVKRFEELWLAGQIEPHSPQRLVIVIAAVR